MHNLAIFLLINNNTSSHLTRFAHPLNSRHAYLRLLQQKS